jgi:hypothetical protein
MKVRTALVHIGGIALLQYRVCVQGKQLDVIVVAVSLPMDVKVCPFQQ